MIMIMIFLLFLSATQETVEVDETASQFVEIGYISSVHGLQGEVRVKPNTDFPELRFAEVQVQILLLHLLDNQNPHWFLRMV